MSGASHNKAMTGQEMRAALLVGIIAVSGCAPTMTTLELGDPLPRDASSMGEMLLVSPAQILLKVEWIYDGVRYTLCGDTQDRIQFISTSSVRVTTPEGVQVGQPLSELRNIKGSDLARHH